MNDSTTAERTEGDARTMLLERFECFTMQRIVRATGHDGYQLLAVPKPGYGDGHVVSISEAANDCGGITIDRAVTAAGISRGIWHVWTDELRAPGAFAKHVAEALGIDYIYSI